MNIRGNRFSYLGLSWSNQPCVSPSNIWFLCWDKQEIRSFWSSRFMIQSLSGTGSWQTGQDQKALLTKCSKYWWYFVSWMAIVVYRESIFFIQHLHSHLICTCLLVFQVCQLISFVFLGRLYALQSTYAKSINFDFPFQILIPLFSSASLTPFTRLPVKCLTVALKMSIVLFFMENI